MARALLSSVQSKRLSIFLSIFVLSAFTSCGGGGGGGGGDGDTNDGTRRTTNTGIRILHGALDIEPVDLKIGEKYLGRTSFMKENFYAESGDGSQVVTLERANSPGVNIYSAPLALADKTEYSLLLSGMASHNNFAVTVLEEPIVRPEKGLARMQLVNLLEGSPPLTLTAGGVSTGAAPFRLASGYVELAAGPQVLNVTNAQGGLVSSIPFTIADRGEVTVMLGGFTSENIIVARVFTDLD